MEIQLKKFDMSQIKDDKVVVLIGKRETGKSFLCKDLLHHHKDYPLWSSYLSHRGGKWIL